MSFHHIMSDVVKICQWYNGLTHMDYTTLHTSHVQFGHSIVFDLQKTLQHQLSQNNVLLVRPLWLSAIHICFLGIELDSIQMESRLFLDKVDKIKLLLNTFIERQKVTLNERQSFIGTLNFACRVVSHGRPFPC